MQGSVKMMLTAAVAVFAGCATQAVVPTQTLRGTDVKVADQAPEQKAYTGKRPGTQKPIPRTFVGQPPLIPHATNNFDEISLEENQCLTCHGLDVYKKKKAPKIGDAHLITGQQVVSMGRYQCTTCHVPQVDAKPLVDNGFIGTVQAR